MATLVLGTVGFVVAGPLGANIGAAIGGVIDSGVFGSDSGNRRREGPRLSDLAVQSSAYGVSIPIVYGTARSAGNVIWSTGLIEREEQTTTETGGKGGGSQTVTDVQFVYSASFAVALAARPISGIGRIWADGKLLRDGNGQLAVSGQLRIYTGSEIQKPDPLIEASESMADTPAFRGLAYIVFEDLALAEYGNRIPNLTIEIMAAANGEALATVVSDLALRTRTPAVEATGLETTVPGYIVLGPLPARRALESLGSAFPFTTAESDGAIRFRPIDGGDIATVSSDEIGARLKGNSNSAGHLRRRRIQELELPREITLHYFDSGRDYQTGAQRARRQHALSEIDEQRNVPVVLDADQAKSQAEIALALAWSQRSSLETALPARFLRHDPGDRLDVQLNGRTATFLIREMQVDTGIATVSCMAFDAGALDAGGRGDSGSVPAQSVEPPGDTTLHILDLPVGRGSRTDLLFAAAAGDADGWRGASVFISEDQGLSYRRIAATASASIIGTAMTALNDGPTAFWDDRSSVNVKLLRSDMELESRPALGVLNGANLAVIGDELIQFRDAVLEADGSYTLSGLLRGRHGTEEATGTHAPGDRFALAGAALIALEPHLSLLARPVLIKAVSTQRLLEDAAASAFTYTGRALQPLSPVHLRASRDAAADLTLSWIRRSRTDSGWLDGVDSPLGEEAERYEIEILDSAGTVVRVISRETPDARYSASQQIEDFGVVRPSVDVRIFQLSSRVGRGRALVATV